MLQFIVLSSPIPSCFIHELKFNNRNWQFVYAIETPFELTDENEIDLVVYEYISDLTVKEASSIHAESINIRFKKLSQYLDFLNLQMYGDQNYRSEWIEKNPNEKPQTLELENKNHTYKDLRDFGVNYIASVLEIDDFKTIFAGI